jgi:hypothetical protein
VTQPEVVDNQLMLLPARTSAEAAAWGSAAMEYALLFRDVHFARDPKGVDWRGYQHVTIVRPRFWSHDLPLVIKQANPSIVIDRIPVDTPEALQVVLNVRVYYGWRYGPRTEFDWAQLWPPAVTLIGLHGRSDGELQDPDYPIVTKARMEAVKITTHATLESVERLKAIHPEMFVLIRPLVSFTENGQPRRISPQEFVRFTVPDLSRLYHYDRSLRYVEIHNEPNLRGEGLGGSWRDGAEFGEWFLEVLRLYRALFPDGVFGFPGLSPGPTSAAGGRMDSETFLTQAEAAAQQADWIGLHAYWVSERELTDPKLGFNFVNYRARFPEKLLFITEFGNPNQPKPVVAEQYARYYGMLRRVPGLGGAFAYVVSTSDPVESPRWAWRDEAGQDVGIAPIVGQRTYIRDTP